MITLNNITSSKTFLKQTLKTEKQTLKTEKQTFKTEKQTLKTEN